MKITIEFANHAELVDYCQSVVQKQEETKIKEKDEALSRPVETLDLPVMTVNALRGAGILTVGDVMSKNKEQLRNIYSLGNRGFTALMVQLALLGLEIPSD